MAETLKPNNEELAPNDASQAWLKMSKEVEELSQSTASATPEKSDDDSFAPARGRRDWYSAAPPKINAESQPPVTEVRNAPTPNRESSKSSTGEELLYKFLDGEKPGPYTGEEFDKFLDAAFRYDSRDRKKDSANNMANQSKTSMDEEFAKTIKSLSGEEFDNLLDKASESAWSDVESQPDATHTAVEAQKAAIASITEDAKRAEDEMNRFIYGAPQAPVPPQARYEQPATTQAPAASNEKRGLFKFFGKKK
ncbi:hypothetical protein IKT18_00695 [Candidatus Saccharibacteria bacterium]|nr:hypothetical protein [Candidatus Saccharibacteria bacterium]